MLATRANSNALVTSVLAATVALCVCVPSVAAADAAKKYTEWKFNDHPEWKKKRTEMIANGKAADKAEEDVFKEHYRFAIGELTRPALAGKFSEKRSELKKHLNVLGNKPDASLHDALSVMLRSALPKVFNSEDFHPASRVNCLLLYGDLNQKEGDISGKGAQPLASTFGDLLKIVKNADGKSPTILQVAALTGVARHVSDGSLSAEQRRDVANVMVDWIKTPPAKGLSPEVQNFLRRRSADLLRTLAIKGLDPNTSIAVSAALHQFAADDEAPLDDRYEAIRTLGLFDKKSFPEKSVPVFAHTFAALAAELGHHSTLAAANVPAVTTGATGEESDAAQPAVATPAAATNDAPAAAADVPADGGDAPPAAVAATQPPAGAATEPPAEAPTEQASSKSQVTLSPELQTYFLHCVRIGLDGPEAGKGRGLASAANAENGKQLVTTLQGKIEEMIKIVGRKKPGNDDGQKIQKLTQELEALTKEFSALAQGAAAAPDGAAKQARVP